MSDSLLYKLGSGKPNKAWWMMRKAAGLAVPDAFYRGRMEHLLLQARRRADYEDLQRRADYYCKLGEGSWSLPDKDSVSSGHGWLHYVGRLGEYKRKLFHTAYYFDQHDVTRYFNPKYRWSFLPGDVYFTPEFPTVVKSRLLTDDNRNSVLLKLDKLRHFMWVDDPVPFRAKQNKVIFRGKIRSSRLRSKFLELYFGHPWVDAGVVGRNEGCPDEWMVPKKTIRQHLDYKFIMALEGNDVASNLKWVMSSNSLAVMTRPTCETWFMEGTLKPDYHYVEVKEDFSDVEEKLRYYVEHPDEAEEIIRHAHEYIRPFRDERREQLIQLMVMEKYFRTSGQWDDNYYLQNLWT